MVYSRLRVLSKIAIEIENRELGNVDRAALFDPGTGRKCEESAFCCWRFSLKATSPTITPRPKNMMAWISQMNPQTREGQQPHIRANSDASDVLTFRARVSSVSSNVSVDKKLSSKSR